MRYSHIFFDFDGTLADSITGVASAIRYALDKMGAQYGDLQYREYIGPPLRKPFAELLPDPSPENVDRAIAYYRELYPKSMMEQTSLFDGMAEVVKTLSERGYRLCIATSKPEVFAKMIVEKLGIAQYFCAIYGALTDGTRETKEDVLVYALESAGRAANEPTERLIRGSIMIGDRKYDLEAANALGMDCAGVTFGYGSQEELLRYNPVFIAHTPAEITEFLI